MTARTEAFLAALDTVPTLNRQPYELGFVDRATAAAVDVYEQYLHRLRMHLENSDVTGNDDIDDALRVLTKALG